MSNYKKIFCMSVYKIITIITFCVLLMIGSGTIFHAHNSVFMSVLQPAVRIAFLIILILTVIGSYVLLFRFFQNASKKSIIIATLIIVFMMLLVYGIILYNIQPFASSDALMYRILHFIWRRPGNTECLRMRLMQWNILDIMLIIIF